MNEAWRDHPDFLGYIQVSDQGGVRSIDRISEKGRRLRGKTLKASVTKDGHLRLGLWVGKDRCNRYVHVLILEAFAGPRPTPQHDARHLDGNPAHNVLTNLSWGTKHENRMDDLRNNVNVGALRTHCPQGHIYSVANNTKKHYKPGNGSGQRTCRACSNARSYARRHGLPFDKNIADKYFEGIEASK